MPPCALTVDSLNPKVGCCLPAISILAPKYNAGRSDDHVRVPVPLNVMQVLALADHLGDDAIARRAQVRH